MMRAVGKAAPVTVPRHIAIIMDGNGRWATARRLPRNRGHRQGSAVVETLVAHAAQAGIPCMTLYALSIDNLHRPRREVVFLMALLRRFLRGKQSLFTANRIRLRVLGRRGLLSDGLRREIERMEALTAGYDRMTVCVALAYGSREEIVDGVKAACRAAAAGKLDPDRLTPEAFGGLLYSAGIPDPDIFIRTGGEFRLSDFLLWQLSYTELFFTPTLWPDFTVAEFQAIITAFGRRERRFGRIASRG